MSQNGQKFREENDCTGREAFTPKAPAVSTCVREPRQLSFENQKFVISVTPFLDMILNSSIGLHLVIYKLLIEDE